MSTYSKLPLGVTDYSAGIQSVNGIHDNWASMFNAYAAEHGILEPQIRGTRLMLPPSSVAFGRHNTPKVLRAIVKSTIRSNAFGIITAGYVQAPLVVTGISRLGVGVYIIGISQLSAFHAECEPQHTAATDQYIIIPRTFEGGNGMPPAIGIECYTRSSSGGGFDLADIDFVAHIYGTT